MLKQDTSHIWVCVVLDLQSFLQTHPKALFLFMETSNICLHLPTFLIICEILLQAPLNQALMSMTISIFDMLIASN